MSLVEQSLVPLVGGAIVIASFAGLGYLVRRAAGAMDPGSVPEAMATGLGALVLAGGFLNLVGAITLPAVLALEAAGLVGLALNGRILWRRLCSWARDPAAIAVCATLALVYLRSATNAWFALSDDLNGYLEPVARAVQTGALGREPFLLERLTGGPGAYFFLEALFVLPFGYYQISILQPALGILLGAGAAVSYLRRGGVPPVLVVGVALSACVVLARVDYLATAVVLQAGMLTVLVVKLLSAPPRSLPDAVSIGVILGGAISLKVLATPFAGVLIVAWLASDALAHRDELGRIARVAIIAALVASVTIFPWMVSSYLSSGTPLFPMLGVGYYGSAYGAVAFPYDGAVLPYVAEFLLHYKRVLLGIAGLAGGVVAVQWLVPCRAAADRLMLVLALTVVPLVLMIAIAMEATDFLRYAHSSYGAVTIAGLAWACRKLHDHGWWSSPKHVAVGCAGIAVVALLQSPHPHAFAVRSYANLALLATGDAELALRLEGDYARSPPAHAIPLLDPEEQAELTLAQNSARPGATILVSLQRPYLLDLKRNEIWSAGNYGGSVSPPPGFPIDGTEAQIREYLRAVGVDYVMFQYAGREPWFEHQLSIVATGAFEDNPWNDSAARVSVRFRDALRRLLPGASASFRDHRLAVIPIGAP